MRYFDGKCEVCGIEKVVSEVCDLYRWRGDDGWYRHDPAGPIHRFCEIHDRDVIFHEVPNDPAKLPEEGNEQ